MYWTITDGKDATILDKPDIGLTEMIGTIEDSFLSCSFYRLEEILGNKLIQCNGFHIKKEYINGLGMCLCRKHEKLQHFEIYRST